MEIDVVPADFIIPVDRAWTVSMVIKSFKGRKDVTVHLFRPEWDPADEEIYDWDVLTGDPVQPDLPVSYVSCRRIVMESFTEEERDALVDYLKTRYEDKVSEVHACALNFPIPLGLTALSELSEGKDIGFIHFDKIPNYTLPFPVRGYFDLSQHKPLIEGLE
ncbi:hypothetical protein DFW101_0667 [Solidesulfovibrio carbinoliphilus subsp. oakridgensis]|uniref:Uncharacterized protein n=1 Tax=Solidesulfovibrio carbinoliphilus subsp. oakridgensis TaxID=694327 RepID=G7QE28_9BACT|nr:hypothetical protein [Solidesulfovibrio carbinoliphilus]EHJ46684.1 hypothetical protein DFW101_0667 [Solidesulfovibrio carbinoliphilus subsp. oakridgensis]